MKLDKENYVGVLIHFNKDLVLNTYFYMFLRDFKNSYIKVTGCQYRKISLIAEQYIYGFPVQ